MNASDKKAAEDLLKIIAKHKDYLALRVFVTEIVRGTRSNPTSGPFELGRLDGADVIFRYADRLLAPKEPGKPEGEADDLDPYHFKNPTNET